MNAATPLGFFSATAKKATTAVPLHVKGSYPAQNPHEAGFRGTLTRPLSVQNPTVVPRRRAEKNMCRRAVAYSHLVAMLVID